MCVCCLLIIPRPPRSSLLPYTTLFRSARSARCSDLVACAGVDDRRRLEPRRRLEGGWRHGDEHAGRHLPDVLDRVRRPPVVDRKSTRLNSSHLGISYAVFCLKKKKKNK